MDIITLTLNPCVDRTFWTGGAGDITKTEYQTGGKGVNVARVLTNLGVSCGAVCPLGGKTGEAFLRLASEEGVNIIPVEVAAPTRVIDTYVNETDFTQRVDYVRGESLSEAELDALENAVYAALDGAKALAICGSASCIAAARRVPKIITRAKEMGVGVLLDSNGEALIFGIEACPHIIKPNEKELMSLTGAADAQAARTLIERGIGEVLLSLGESGCAYISENREEYCPAPKIDTVNAVGSGDSFTAAYIYATLNGYALRAALSTACAAGAANAAMFPAARITKTDIENLLGWNLI